MQRFKVMQICANALAIIIQLGISDVNVTLIEFFTW